MQKRDADRYDAVIIGAGIGGLVCGCYLAKAGLKVLIAEQHAKPGGYCTSFRRGGFTFDAAAHSFGGYRDGGLVNRVFRTFAINELISIARYDPSDSIVTPDYHVSFWADVARTTEDFRSAFPHEHRALKDFFDFLIAPDPLSLAHMRKWTMKQLLDKYFRDQHLKSILAFPLFGNGGLPPSQMSAFIGINIFREFMLDGGYYPNDRMQSLPDAFAARFREYGGDLKLSAHVDTITVKDGKAEGIRIKGERFYPAKYVIANCDTRQTCLLLIKGQTIHEAFITMIKKMVPSLSMFIAYLGLNKDIDMLPLPGSNIWFLSEYDLDKAYSAAQKGDLFGIDRFMVRVLPGKKCIMALVNSSFKNKHFWQQNKKNYLHLFMKSIERTVIPGLTSAVSFCDAATPMTLFRYTLNYRGAAYGWASTPAQIANTDFRLSTIIKNLYSVGHWTTQGLGIPGVIYSAYDTAQRILKRKDTV